MSIDRRELLKLLAAGAAGGVIGSLKPTAVPAAEPAGCSLQYQGADLSGWEVALGDALYTCPGEPAVTLDDLNTIHYSTYSELQANVNRRAIMAHNITFKRFIDDNALRYIHTCGFKFRLPYQPQQDPMDDMNGQTIEGGIFIWDGISEERDLGIAFQWEINPWFDPDGNINTWTGSDWAKVGNLPVDTAWHDLCMIVDYRRESTALLIDGIHYHTSFTRTEKTGWAAEIAARLQAEIISIDPRPGCTIKAMHKAEFKDWYWYWEEAVNNCCVFLPSVTNGSS